MLLVILTCDEYGVADTVSCTRCAGLEIRWSENLTRSQTCMYCMLEAFFLIPCTVSAARAAPDRQDMHKATVLVKIFANVTSPEYYCYATREERAR